jgi:uncharacterized protein
MDVTPLIGADQQVIQSYGGGQFRVSGKVYEGAVVVEPLAASLWDVSDFLSLSIDDFAALIDKAAEIDVVLLGCGATMAFLPAELKRELKVNGINVDVMDTGAACRTYSVIMAEGRRVVAAMLPV